MAWSSGSSGAPSSNLYPGRGPGDGPRNALVADWLQLSEAERRLCDVVVVELLALAEHDWEHHQAQLVDQAGVCERRHQLRAAVDEDVAVDLVFDAPDFGFHVRAEHVRVVPVGVRERGGHD